jgi:hypothetical protein
MPTSKSKTKPRKLRPYRVDYFLHEEMLKDKALVRSVVIRAVTADVARSKVGDASLNAGRPGDNFTVIRAYRFYKKLTAEPVRKTYIAIDKLLPAKKAIEVMTEIENRKFPIVIRPEDLPYTDPNHVCTDKCIDFVEINPSNEYSADSIKVLKGMDKVKETPCSAYWIGECSGCHATKELVCETDWCDDCIALGCSTPTAAIEAAAKAFRDLGNAAEAATEAFASIQDPPDASVTIECEGQPTQTSSGAAEGWMPEIDNLHAVDLDEAAPIILPRLVLEEGLGRESELTLTVTRSKKSSGLPILLTTLGVIGALVYVYFHYFAK